MFQEIQQEHSQTLEERAKTLEAAKSLEKKLREAISEDIGNRKNRDISREERHSRLENLIKRAEYYNHIVFNAGLDAFSEQEKEDYENTLDELFFLI